MDPWSFTGRASPGGNIRYTQSSEANAAVPHSALAWCPEYRYGSEHYKHDLFLGFGHTP